MRVSVTSVEESPDAPKTPDDGDVPETPVVYASDDDPTLRSGREGIGGRMGRHALVLSSRLTPLRVLVLLSVLGFLAGYLMRTPCHNNGFAGSVYPHMCYSDIPPLFAGRGFADGLFPFLQSAPGIESLEYPVLTGLFMWVAALLTGSGGTDSERALLFFDWNALMLAVCLVVVVIATAMTVRRRPWDAAMVALAPGVILTSLINWDLFAMAFTAVGFALWSRRRTGWAGVMLGLGAASKFYPVILFGPLLLVCLRAGRMRDFWKALAGAVVSWSVVNLPFMLGNFETWSHFYTFSANRGQDFGSIWYALSFAHINVPPESLNKLATGSFFVLCTGIAALALWAPRRPRLASLCFLAIAAFCLTNKVYSPQYVLWLIPFAVMARPRWRDFLIWQTCEAVYFMSVWLFLEQYSGGGKGIPGPWYSAAIWLHVAGTLFFAIMVIRDVWWPKYDPVRTDGHPDDVDDPGGGPVDGAPDRVALGRRRVDTSTESPVELPVESPV